MSALQFIPFKVSITQDVIENKSLKVYLIERINNLDEVVILPHNLTGNLETDTEKATLEEHIAFTFGSYDNFDLADDYHSAVTNAAMPENILDNMADAVKILHLFMPNLFKSNKKNKESVYFKSENSNLLKNFADDYFVGTYNIPKEKVGNFIIFVENNDFDGTLLDSGHEMQLIEHLFKQSKLFLKS